MVMTPMAQDPQAYVDDQGNEYVREGNRWRVIRPGQQAAPQAGPTAPQGVPGLIPMVTPAEQRAREEREYDRQRDAVRDERLDRTEERQVAAAERANRNEERQIEAQQRAGTPESRGRLATAIGPSVLAQDSLARQEFDASGRGVNPLNRDWGAAALDSVPDFGLLSPIARAWGGQDYQDYNQSLKTVEASLLPVFSGMAVTPQEAQRFIRANQPQIGDSPETLQRKARNRQTILNEAAEMLQRPIPYPEIGRYGEEGFRERASQDGPAGIAPPTVNDGRQVQRADDALAVAPGEYAADYVARFDRDGDNRASVEEMEAAGWQFDFDADKWFPPGGDAGGSPPPAGPQGGQPPQGGGEPRSAGYQTALGQERANADLVAKAGGGYGMTDALTGEFNDELAYGAGYLTQGLGNLGRRLTGRDIEVSAEERARAARDVMAQDRDRFAREQPVQNVFGNVLGGAAFGPSGAAKTLVGRMGQGAGMGATYGFAGAEGNVVERLPSAAIGAGIGAVATPVVEKAVAPAVNWLSRPAVEATQSALRFTGRQAGNIGNALGVPGSRGLVAANQPNALSSGVAKFSRLSPQNLDEMGNRGNALSAEGIDPTFVDLVSDGGRGTFRATATRQTPGRDRAREFAEGRVESLPGRISAQSRRIVSSDNRPVQRIVDDLDEARSLQAERDYAGPYREQVPVTNEMASAISDEPGRAALRRARRAAVARRNYEQVDEIDRLLAGDTSPVMAGTVDRTRIAMAGRGRNLSGGQNADRDVAGGLFARAEDIDSSLANIPAIQPARDAYRQATNQIEATELGGRFLQSGPDEMIGAVQGMTPAQLEPVRAAVARNIEIAARTPGSAPTVARRLYADNEIVRPGGMGEAVLGPDGARLAQAARMEALAVRNGIEINPRAGSPTNLNQQDTLTAAGEALGAVRDVATNNWANLVPRVWRTLGRNGINDAEASAILDAAVDPARTNEMVDLLAQHMTRREARSLARAIRYQVTTSLPSNQ